MDTHHTSVSRGILYGLAAGAAGTTALNLVTYADMAVRARPASSTPQDTVQALADTAGVEVPGDDDARQARLNGLGPISGILAGVGTGALVGAARALGVRVPTPIAGALVGAAAMAAADAPMTALGVTDPRDWAAKDWVADAVPHLIYGLVTVAVLRALDRH